jgi:uncharacterized protein
MNNTKLKDLIIEYLQQAKLLQVATSKDNQPWACTVYFAHDENLNLYWISTPKRRHSIELRINPKVAGIIVLPHIPGDEVRGLQFQGTAQELRDPDEALTAMQYYKDRYNMPPARVDAIINDTDGHLCYKITPSTIVLFDELNFPDNPRQEYQVRS